MAYFADIAHIFLSEPNMVDVNAKEYDRVAQLVEKVARAEITKVKANIDWIGDGRQLFDRKVDELLTYLGHLGGGLAAAVTALDAYVVELRKAKNLVVQGRLKSYELKKLMAPYHAIPRDTPDGGLDPLRLWEMLLPMLRRRASSDYLEVALRAVIVINVGSGYYRDTRQLFAEAKQIEQQARASCVPALDNAYRSLPDFEVNPEVSREVIQANPFLAGEMAEARNEPGVRLPGTGVAPPYLDNAVVGDVSPALQSIRDEVALLRSGGTILWDQSDTDRWTAQQAPGGATVPGETEEQFRDRWISHNREAFHAAAARYGLPAELIAAVAYHEIGGPPMSRDDRILWRRQNIPGFLLDLYDGGERASLPPDYTSMGAIDMQIRRAAETLGYDPANLTDTQRTQIIYSLRDARQQVFIVAKYLSDLKQATDFPLVDGAALTDDQFREIAVRYSQGPYWRSQAATAFAPHYTNLRDHIRSRGLLR